MDSVGNSRHSQRSEAMTNESQKINEGPNFSDLKVKEENSPGDYLEWKDGVGTLPGCEDLKFRRNENGEVEVITEGVQKAQNFGTVKKEHNEHKTEEIQVYNDPDRPDISGKQNEMITEGVQKAQNFGGVGDGLLGTVKKEYDEHKTEEIQVYNDPNRPDISANFEIVNVRSDAQGEDSSVSKCVFCGVTGKTSKFRGTFCSTRCVSKNANQHRQIVMRHRSRLANGNVEERQSNVNGESNAKSKDLKIRIRIPSSPSPADVVETSGRRKHSTSSHELPSIVNKTHGAFSWPWYAKEGATLAPPSSFEILSGKSPFPGTNSFKLGMALEGVDPVHQSLICPLSVTAVKGFRVRLHFCGYSESYDFWTNADSPLIFPCGFCEKTGRKLEPPKGYQSDSFVWEKYMKKFRLYAAPDVIFSVISEEKECSFNSEEKLEAVDKHNPDLICVATIGDVIGENILIHFDGWTHDFDYWCTASSRLIHKVGWCKMEGKALTPPEGYPVENFSWETYLAKCGAKAANDDSFSPTIPHGLESGMKLEVVDPRNTILIRVGSILSVTDYQLRIHFDGWSDIYDFWTDLESPDIHPPGWCDKARYPLQPPMDELTSAPGQSGCPVPGCIGVGHVRGSKFAGHHSEFGCPYSQQNLSKQNVHDRLARSRPSTSVQEAGYKSGSDGETWGNEQPRPAKLRKTRKSIVNESDGNVTNVTNGKVSPTGDQPKQKTILSSSELDVLIDKNGKNHYSPQNHSVYVSALSSFPNYDLPLCWDQHSKILPGVKGITVSDVSKWTSSEVASFVNDLTGGTENGKVFISEEIDGEAMLLLTQTDIVKVLNIKLGPAVKIYNAILLVKAAEKLPA